MDDAPLPHSPSWPPAARHACGALLLLALMAITWLALSPAPPRSVDTGWDKSNHALAFATLAVLAGGACGPARRWRWHTAWALLAYGVAIEVAQSFTPTRSAEALDVLADAAGIFVGQWLMQAVWRRRPSPPVR